MPAWGNFVLDKGMNANAAITKFRAVKLVGSATPETVTPVTAITDDPVGWAQFSVSAAEITKGKGCPFRAIGVTEAEASGAVAIGQRCQLEADGRVKVLVGASGARIVGLCVGTPSTNAGDRITMLIWPGGALA
jgi:hypothetical protein